MRKNWIFKTQDEGAAASLAAALSISRTAARLLVGRGFETPEAARAFLSRGTEGLHDPFLLRDMDRAVARIRRALEAGERITVYGDYDVDGVTSTTLVVRCLRSLGAEVDYYIPARMEEGYGVNAAALEQIAARGSRLVITVDTGITAVAEAVRAKEIGLSLVVTDHHQCGEQLPDCDAVINPHRPDCSYPFPELAGVGVALKLCTALTGDPAPCFELAALGTIADVMPLVGENRILVAQGLRTMARTENIGLRALMREAGLDSGKVRAGTVGFTLAPRINAAGRMGTAGVGVELFLTEDPARAEEIAKELCKANAARQAEENRILKEALEQQAAASGHSAIVLGQDGWHSGVIGIVASRLLDRFYRPTLLVSFDGAEGHGSGRSVAGFNLVEALRACGGHLVKFGGHEMAAGLTVERSAFPAFREAFLAVADAQLTEEMLTPAVTVDCVLEAEDLTLKTVADIALLEPYGMGNPTPAFGVLGAQVVGVTPLSGGKHTKYELAVSGRRFTALYFGRGPEELGFYAGDVVDVVCTLDVNTFRGNESLQLLIKEMRIPPALQQRLDGTLQAFQVLTTTGDTAAAGDGSEPLPGVAGVLPGGEAAQSALVGGVPSVENAAGTAMGNTADDPSPGAAPARTGEGDAAVGGTADRARAGRDVNIEPAVPTGGRGTDATAGTVSAGEAVQVSLAESKAGTAVVAPATDIAGSISAGRDTTSTDTADVGHAPATAAYAGPVRGRRGATLTEAAGAGADSDADAVPASAPWTALPAGALPSRAECVQVFRFIGEGVRALGWDALYRRAGKPWCTAGRSAEDTTAPCGTGDAPEPGFFKFLVAIRAFADVGLVEVDEHDGLTLRQLRVEGKRNLEDSATLRRLKNLSRKSGYTR